jgi:flagellar hook-associated protein FlgK
MNTISIARSGMNAAQLQLDVAANNIANSQTPGYKRQSSVQQAAPGGGVTSAVVTADTAGESLAEDMVTQMSAGYAFKANLKVLQTQHHLLGALLDEEA